MIVSSSIVTGQITQFMYSVHLATLAKWLRRVPPKDMGFPCEGSNILGDDVY